MPDLGGTNTPARFAAIQTSASGDTTIVAAVPDKRIILLAYNYMANGAVNVKWRSNTTDLTGLAYLVANGGKVCPFANTGWAITALGEALVINLSAAIAVGGEVAYAVV